MRKLLICLLLLGCGRAWGAGCTGTGNCYWIGGAGNTNDTAHWATASGGATTGGLPGSGDNCIFDANSDSGSAFTVTVNATANCANLDFGAVDQTPTLAGNQRLNVYGSAVFASGMTASYNGQLYFNPATGTTKTLTTNGVTINAYMYHGGLGTLQLVDDLNLGQDSSLTISAGGVFDAVTNSRAVAWAAGRYPAINPSYGTFNFYDVSVTGYAGKVGSFNIWGNIDIARNLTVNGNSPVNRLLIAPGVRGTQTRITVWGSGSFSNVDFQDIWADAGEVVLMGDSITNQYAPPFVPLMKGLNAGWSVSNKGGALGTTTQMVARFTADVLNNTKAKYVVILGGANDVGGGATTKSNLQTMYTAAAGAGLIVVAVTLTPRGNSDGWTAEKQADLEDVNSWIKNTATDVDYVVDAYATLHDPANPTYLLPAYDLDHIHLTDPAGINALATAVFNAVPSWIGTVPWNLSSITGGSGDAGGNQGITFSVPAVQYWKHGATASDSWSSSNWYTTSGGSTPGRVPLPQDAAVFDANSFPASGKTVTVNMPRLPTTTFAGVTNSPTVTTSTAASVFGSLTLAPSANWTWTASTQTYTFEGRGPYKLRTNGNTWSKNLILNAPGGVIKQCDTTTFAATYGWTTTNGTLGTAGCGGIIGGGIW